jgi:MoxR-like ATPase
MPDDWRIFRGDKVKRGQVPLPPPPPWRSFPRPADQRGQTFQASEHEVRLVNAALYLRRPLLVTGPPGSGKSSLAYAVAWELELGPVLAWSINSRSTLAEGLYRYDAIARLRDASLRQSGPGNGGSAAAEPDIGAYLTLGPLGTALLPRDRPRVLLIDEIDKSDIDLPNDLLHVFEEGRFEVPELVRVAARQPSVRVLPSDGRDDADKVTVEGGRVETRAFPFVVITSNGERELPPAFLRRCLRLETPKPDLDRLTSIVRAHLGQVNGTPVDELIRRFLDQREEGRLLAIDQLLNAIFLVSSEKPPEGEDWDLVRETLLRALDEE